MIVASEPLANAQHPWIGLASFTEGDCEFFAGRGDEIDELLRLLQRDTLTLLYGVSGLGKTSLLHAGIFQAVRKNNWLPVAIRLDYTETAPPLAAQVLLAISTAAAAARVEAPAARPSEGLWEFFHREDNHFWSPHNDLVMPFLVFDQFEEVFTLGRENLARGGRVSEFISELAGLVENRPPAALREDPPCAREFNFRPASLKVLLAMREDYLAELDGIRSQFRALGQNRLRLLPMGERQARQVIDLGASLLAPGVADRIVEFVTGRESNGEETTVAPALLSLVLRELNERRLALGPEAKITPDLLDVEKQKILENFYLRTVHDFPAGVRNFIEDELLTATGYRNSCALDDALRRPEVTSSILDQLVNRRLLSYEDRHQARRVEITHDVLAPVIKTSRDTRLTREALAQAERQEAEAREKAGVVQRVQTTTLAVALLLAALWLVSAVFVGKRPDQGSQWLSKIYQELQKETAKSPDQTKIEEARRELRLLASQSKPDPQGFYGNAQLYADMSQIAETLARDKKLDTKDKLLADIYETLGNKSLTHEETLNRTSRDFKKLADNPQAAIARFTIDNYQRDHNRASFPLQAFSLFVVLVVLPVWLTRRFLGRESIWRKFRRPGRNEVANPKRPNPFFRMFAAFVDLVIAVALGALVGRLFLGVAGILGVWFTGEISDTAWGLNHLVGLFGLFCCSSLYLLFCDAIHYTQRRSIGKIVCRLVPVTLTPEGGAVSMGVSAKRNGLLALAWGLITFYSFSPTANDPALGFVREWIGTLKTLGNAGAILFVFLGIEEFILAWFKDGRTVLDRLSGTKVVREA